MNDINLAWALLLNSGKGHDGIKDDFILWQVLMRAAPLDFKKKIFDFDDIDLRFSFVQDALKWAQGGEQAKPLESTFEGFKLPRLRRTLRDIEKFGLAFDANSLDDFLHLSAPEKPKPEPEIEKDAKSTPAAMETEVSEIAEEAVAPELEPALETDRVKMDMRVLSHDNARLFGKIEFMPIPKGKFIMGSKDDDTQASDSEKPQHTLEISYDYWLSRTPIINVQFSAFIEATGYKTTAEE